MKNIILISFIFISYTTINAQITATGKVTDNNNQAIEFANVILLNTENKEIVAGTITDEEGNFTVKTSKKGKFSLQISFVGFENYTKDIGNTIDLGNIALKWDNTLDEVTITARKNIIERKEDKIIFNLGASPFNKGYNAIEVLRRSPSVWIDGSGNILIHNNVAVVLINGRKINLKGSDLTDYVKTLDSDDIEKIEIQTNSSANIDAENLGGVINIILKSKQKGFNGRLKSYYTYKENGFYTINPSVNFNYGTDTWNIYGNYGYKNNTDNPVSLAENLNKTTDVLYKTDGDIDEKNNTNNYQLGFVYDISKKQKIGIEAFGSKFSNNTTSNSGINILQSSNTLDTGSIISTQDNSNNIFNGIFNYSLKLDSTKSNLAIVLDYTKKNIDNNNHNVSSYDLASFEGKDDRNNSTSKSEIFSSQIDFQKGIEDLFDFEIGTKYTKTNRTNGLTSETLQNKRYVKNDRTSSFDYNESVVAGYFSANKKIKNYFVKMGLRYEYTDFKGVDLLNSNKEVKQSYDNYFPSVYLSRNLKNNKSISISYSKGINRPSFSVLNDQIIKLDDFNFSVGNPKLRAEHTSKYNISFNTQSQLFSIHYSKKLDDINTVWFVKDGENFHQVQNSGTTNQFGLDYGIRSKINKWWYSNLKISSVYRTFKIDKKSSNKPSFMISAYNAFKINETTSIDFSVKYISPFIEANFTSPHLFETNLVFQKSILKDKLSLRFYIDDIFNTLRDEVNGEFDNLSTIFYQKRKTRSFTIWLSYNFSNKKKVNNNHNQSKNDTRNRL